MPSSVTPKPPALGRRWVSVRAKSSGSDATATSRTWNWSPYNAASSSPPSAMNPARRTGCARSYIANSSCMQMQPSTNSPAANTRPPASTRTSASATAGRAVSARAPSSERSSGRSRRRVRPGRAADRRTRVAIRRSSAPAEASAPAGKLGQRLFQRGAREVRPELAAEHQLRVRRLPQQVVRQALLAAGADDQVGVVHLGRVQAVAKLLLGAALEAAGGVEDLGPATVVEGDEQRDATVALGQRLGPAHLLDEPLRDPLAAADEAHPNPLLMELGRLACDPSREHVHQALYLFGRARPVLGRERVDGQLLDAQLGGVAQARLDRVGAGIVAIVHGDPVGAR